MDCCNYPEYRAQYGWECAGQSAAASYAAYAPPMPYTPYAASFYTPSHAHDPYSRYAAAAAAAAAYHYEYPASQHAALNEHITPTPMDYGAYVSKESRVRRAQARREVRARTPIHHHQMQHTPPLECGLNGRGSSYCEPQMWSHYQHPGNALHVGWNGVNPVGSSWGTRGVCAREVMRHPQPVNECRSVKSSQLNTQNQMCAMEERSTPYPVYDDQFNSEQVRRTCTPEYVPNSAPNFGSPSRGQVFTEPPPTTPEEKRPAPVPLPAFQQAFGSTEIGRFAEAFSRAEIANEEAAETVPFETFSEWDGNEPWSTQQTSREIKCEDNY